LFFDPAFGGALEVSFHGATAMAWRRMAKANWPT
jgi:hypothetical protein